jgi:hypothetical protein
LWFVDNCQKCIGHIVWFASLSNVLSGLPRTLLSLLSKLCCFVVFLFVCLFVFMFFFVRIFACLWFLYIFFFFTV